MSTLRATRKHPLDAPVSLDNAIFQSMQSNPQTSLEVLTENPPPTTSLAKKRMTRTTTLASQLAHTTPLSATSLTHTRAPPHTTQNSLPPARDHCVDTVIPLEPAVSRPLTVFAAGLITHPNSEKKLLRSLSIDSTETSQDEVLPCPPQFFPPVPAAAIPIPAKLTLKEKNREHAKNTRRRKKQFIEDLQQRVADLQRDQEMRERESKIVAGKMAEQTKLRRRVLQECLTHRVNGMLNRNVWSTLLEETVTMTLPVTTYRSFPPFEVRDGQRVVRGIDSMMLDAASLHAFLQGIAPQNDREQLKISVSCAFEDACLSQTTLSCPFALQTHNAASLGASQDLCVHGLCSAAYSAHHKLSSLRISFDTLAIVQQLRPASMDSLCVESDCRLLVEMFGGEPVVAQASQTWLDSFLCESSVVGRSVRDVVLCRILEREKAAELADFLSHGLPHCIVATMDICGAHCLVWLKLFPVYDNATPSSRSQCVLVMQRLDCGSSVSTLSGLSMYSLCGSLTNSSKCADLTDPARSDDAFPAENANTQTVDTEVAQTTAPRSVVVNPENVPAKALSSISLAFRRAQE